MADSVLLLLGGVADAGSGGGAVSISGSGEGINPAGVPGVTPIPAVTGSGTGITGDAPEGSGGVRVSGSGSGVTGQAGSGEGEIAVSGDGEGIHGNAADGEGAVSVTGSGEGAAVTAAEVAPAWQAYQTFAVNLLTGTVTEYSTQFQSRCVLNGQVYAAGPTGLHRVGGTTDAGAAIPIVLAKAGIDGGSRLRKRAADCFTRLSSSGNFDLSVESERRAGTVVLYDGISRAHGAKANLPKGVDGAEHSFTLQARDGAVLHDLFEVELLFTVSERRRGRQVNG